jgi:hypothetical protein
MATIVRNLFDAFRNADDGNNNLQQPETFSSPNPVNSVGRNLNRRRVYAPYTGAETGGKSKSRKAKKGGKSRKSRKSNKKSFKRNHRK